MLPKTRSWAAWLGYFFSGLLGLLLLLAFVGAIYQKIEYSQDRRMNPPSGQLVDVGGYRMHIDCIGRGSPTAVLDSGLSDSSLSWYKVQPEVAQFTRVCSYDRAGLGWSEPSPNPRNSGVFAEELHTLLRNAKVDGPFVLVGHSMGGYDVRIFASRFPSQVVGIVLVDSTHPDYANQLPELRTSSEKWRRQLRNQEFLMPFGLPRLMGWCGNGPSEIQASLRTIECNVSRLRESIAESLSIWNESAAQVRATGSLGDLPLIVISEDPAKNVQAFLPVFEAGQQTLASLSSNSVRMTALGSGHQIQRDRPDIVIVAIKQIVEETRPSPLNSLRLHMHE
jgi:pimeloyl-ACP methyl ester carboxylesterase